MTEKIKKILTIIGFIAFTILAAIMIWFLFFKTTDDGSVIDNNSNNNNNNQNQGNLTPSGNNTNNGKPIEVDNGQNNTGDTTLTPDQIKDIINKNNGQDLNNIVTGGKGNTNNVTDLPKDNSNIANGNKVLTNNVVTSPTLSSSISGNSLVYFNKNDGGFYKLDPNIGKTVLMTDDKFKGAKDITWSPNSNKVIIEFPDGSNVTYDFINKKQYTLPTSWYSFSFQKDSDKIAFMIDSKIYNERWLSVANPDGSGFSAIEPLGNNADKVIVSYSPNEQMIAFSATADPVGVYQQQMFIVGLHGENFKALNIQGRGFHPLWSPKGNKLVYDSFSDENGYAPNLWVANATSSTIGTSNKSLGVATWISKCAFDASGVNLYCGVPRAPLPAGSGLFPDTLDDAGIYDDIYKINVSTGMSTLIAKPVPDIAVESLEVSSDSSMIYCKDKRTGNIYSIRLK